MFDRLQQDHQTDFRLVTQSFSTKFTVQVRLYKNLKTICDVITHSYYFLFNLLHLILMMDVCLFYPFKPKFTNELMQDRFDYTQISFNFEETKHGFLKQLLNKFFLSLKDLLNIINAKVTLRVIQFLKGPKERRKSN